MSSARRYNVYTARFPFLDSSKSKIRPVIVLSQPYSVHKVVAVVPISSKLNPETVDVAINDLGAAGLLKPSVAQTHRLGTLLQSDLITQLGTLNVVDASKLQQSIRSFLGL